MKHMKKIMALGLIITALFVGQSVDAAEKAKDEGWDIPNIALGNGLTDQEKQATTDILTKDLDKVDVLKGVNTKSHNEFIVDGSDLVK
ncbi:hypothetical protein [Vagococcus jeotgali]|uniref:hypothetical protein n=1 Tax=Vagococcus jeotgali TaxID=3109030 RepID=UPI002DD9912F|nr:hypothetical protein [Vagococcus sp. B2T-5]